MADESAFLWDMLKSAERVRDYVTDMTWEEFEHDLSTQDAICWRLSIIGEAAKHVSNETRARLANLPFADMARMRDKMIHVYWRVDLKIVWSTAKRDMRPLIDTLSKLLPPETTRA